MSNRLQGNKHIYTVPRSYLAHVGWVGLKKKKKKTLDQTYAHPNYNFSSFHIKMDLTY